MTDHYAYISILSADSASNPIVFSNIEIKEDIGYYAETPLRIQFWNEDANGGY